MIGIYKFQNKENGRCYIGQSINIQQRYYGHKSAAFNEKAPDYDSQFHQAIRKYGGLEAFSYEIVIELPPEEYTREKLNELEKYYIAYYNSYKNGYNASEGGDAVGNNIHPGESNGRALLTEEDVIYIRECYNAHIPFKTVYEEYKDKISKRGLQKVWWFDTWKHIHPEYHSEENKYWHSHQAKANTSAVAANNQRSFSDDEVRQMRTEYANGMSPKEIWQKYAPNRVYSTVYNAITGATYKNVN